MTNIDDPGPQVRPAWGPPPTGDPADTGYSGPPGPPGYGPPPPPPPLPPPRRRRTGLRVLGIVAAVVIGVPAVLFLVALIAVAARGGPDPATPGVPAAASSPPGTTQLGQNGLLQLRPGDCFNSVPIPRDGSTASVPSVERVSCTGPHTRQVVNTFAYPGTTWEGGGDAQSAEHCTGSLRTKLREEVRADSSYMPARIHTVLTSSEPSTVYVVCLLGTEAPKSGSALK